MSNLTNYNKDGLELVIDTQTGEAFSTISGTARMTDKDKQTIHAYVTGGLKTVSGMTLKSAEIHTSTGLKTVSLLSEEQIVEVVTKYKPELLAKFAKLGVRVFLHQLAGYEVKSTAIEVKPKTAIELAEEQLVLVTKQVELLKEIEAKNQQLALANSQIEILEEANLEQAEVIDELFDYSSIVRIAKYNNCSEKTFSWHKLKAASLALNLEIKKAPCPRFETKNLYSHDVWKFVYPGYKLPEDNQGSNIIPFPKVN